MIHSTTHHLRLPIYGQANQPQVAPQQGCPYCSDPVLEARKGRLYLLATPDTERDLLKRFALRYYGHPSYDIMPTLHEAMAFAHSDHGLQGAIHVAVIVHDLSVYAVATDGRRPPGALRRRLPPAGRALVHDSPAGGSPLRAG